jgi:hypothetical protein
MTKRTLLTIVCVLFATFFFVARVSAQSPQPYPNAVTDRLIHQETPMTPPPKNVVFVDPDFGSSMVRATDASTNFKAPGTFLRTEGSGAANEWSADTKKFYVLGTGGFDLVFALDPLTMAISSLPQASSGKGFHLPLRPGPSFSFVDPDLIYGTADPDTLTIVSYRFSTGVSTPIIDTRTCGLQPPLGSGRSVVSDDDVAPSADDNRISISEGGPQFGKHMFVVVYDKILGCRWYNTQTGQIGGQWGPTGSATTGTRYLIGHAHLSRSGNYVRITTNSNTWYLWDLATLTVASCPQSSALDCGGYGIVGYNSFVNGPGTLDDMNIVKRPLSDLSQIAPLVYPLPATGWGQEPHFTWSNVDASDSTPVCASTWSYDGDRTIDQPFAGEIFCIETDGVASTVWRFAHNRAVYITPFFHTQPLGSVSLDGRFYLFTSDWDAQLGTGTDGKPRSDVFIVKLN